MDNYLLIYFYDGEVIMLRFPADGDEEANGAAQQVLTRRRKFDAAARLISLHRLELVTRYIG